MTDLPARPRATRLWAAVGAASLVLLASRALEWSLADWLTPFLLAPLLVPVWLLMLGVFASALFHAWRRPWREWLPALACIAAIAFALLAPFARWWLWADFHRRLAAREAVIADVQAGTLAPNVAHNASLIALDGRAQVSAGGNEVVVERHQGSVYLFFYTERGVLDRYAGYLWVAADGDPQMFDDGMRGHARIEGMGEFDGKGRWYFISRQ